MAQKKKKTVTKKPANLKDVLLDFDIEGFKVWYKANRKFAWKGFESMPEEYQIATMCRVITNRTDMISTSAYRKAVEWLKDHKMNTGIIY